MDSSQTRARSRSQGAATASRQTPEVAPQNQAALAATSPFAGAAAPPASSTGSIQAPVDPNTPISGTPTGGTAPPAPPTPDYHTLGQYANRLGGYDMSKFSNPYDQWSEKYKIGAVQSHFDPQQGLTPEVIAALNSLGIAQFGGSGDQLSVQNTKGDPRFGVGGTADVVKGLKGNNADTGWNPWLIDSGGAPMGGGQMPGMQAGGSGLNLPYPAAGGNVNLLNPSNMPFYGGDILRYLAQQLGMQNVLGGQTGQR